MVISNETDHVNTSYNQRKQTQDLLKANKSLRSTEDLKSTALTNVSSKAVEEINKYNPEDY